MLTLLLAALLALIVLRHRFASFAAQRPTDYATGPRFDPREHLSGPMLCEGVIHGPTGRVTSRFVADLQGDWQGDAGTLAETFRYGSGTVQHRQWALVLGPGGTVRATAADVVGEAVGQATGAAVVLRYRLRLPPEAGGHVLDVTDWMYLLENGNIMNRSQFRKFGVKVAELVATLRKVPQ